MFKFRITWTNLVYRLNRLVLPKVEVEEVQDGDSILEAIAKLQAQITAMNES